MTIEGIFDRAKAMAKIKFDAEAASIPSSLNISDAEMNEIADSLAVYETNKNHEVTRLSYGFNNDEVRVGQILRLQDSYNNQRRYGIVTWIDSGEADKRTGFPNVQTRVLNFDGTLGDVCALVPFNPRIVYPATDEEFCEWANKRMRTYMYELKESIRQEQINLRQCKKDYNKFSETFKKNLNKFRNW